MTTEATSNATAELSLTQLVQASGINTSRVDDTIKIPSQIDGMIDTANRQLEAVVGHMAHLDEMTKRIADARETKAAEKDRLHKVLIGLHDARAAMSKP